MDLTEKDIEIMTEDGAYWKEIVVATEKAISDLKKALKFQEAVLNMARLSMEDANRE